MDGYLRQSTASQSRLIGPFIDDADFKTAETGLTIANTDIKVRANGSTLSNKNSGGGTHEVNGHYSLTWDATDTANVGELKYSVVVAGSLQVFGSYTVLEEAVYDAMFAASAPGYVANATVNAVQLAGQTITAAAGVTFPTSVASPTNITAGTITTVTTLTNDPGGVTTLLSRLTSTRAGYLDNLSAGAVALASSLASVASALATVAGYFTTNRPEPAQGAPAASTTFLDKVDFMYKLGRNKLLRDATTLKVFADDGTTVDHKATVTDDGTTYTRGEIVSGP